MDASTSGRGGQRQLREDLSVILSGRSSIEFEWRAAQVLARVDPSELDTEIGRNHEYLSSRGSVEVIANLAIRLRRFALEREIRLERAVEILERG